jgi:hypothetical protein
MRRFFGAVITGIFMVVGAVLGRKKPHADE